MADKDEKEEKAPEVVTRGKPMSLTHAKPPKPPVTRSKPKSLPNDEKELAAMAAGIPIMKHLSVANVVQQLESDSEPEDNDDNTPTPPPPNPPNALQHDIPPKPAPKPAPAPLASVPKPAQISPVKSLSSQRIPDMSPISSASASSPSSQAVMLATMSTHRNVDRNLTGNMCLYGIAFIFLFPIEPLLFLFNLLWTHAFPPLIEADNLVGTHLDIIKRIFEYIAMFVLCPLSLGVFKKGFLNQKDASVFGCAYIFYLILVVIFLIVWIVCAAVIAVILVIVSICLYMVLALLVAIFIVLSFIASVLHRIVVKVWTEVIAPFFDHPIVSDMERDLTIVQMESEFDNPAFIILGIIGSILLFPITVFSSVLFGLEQTVKPILRVSFVHVLVPMFASMAMWTTALIFVYLYYNGTEQYDLSEVRSVETVRTSMLFVVGSAFSLLILIIYSICFYRRHCTDANNVTPFPSYFLLIPGFIFIGPIMILFVPFWADYTLSFSWYLWDMIWFKRKDKNVVAMGFVEERTRSYSKTLAQKNKKKKKSSDSGITKKHRIGMMFSWVLFGIPTFLVYPIAFICEPLPNFPYNRIIVPFCNSLLFWVSLGTSSYLWSTSTLTEYLYIPLIIMVISLIVLIICAADYDNLQYISSNDERTSLLMYPWVFCANLLSFPALILGFVWPCWPMTVMRHFNTDAHIATERAKQSGIPSPRFWVIQKAADAPESTTFRRILSCVFGILAIPMFVVWIVSFGCYNIFKYEGHYYAVTYLVSLLICGSWIDYYFEFYMADVSLIILVICGLFALMLSYFFVCVTGPMRIAIQFVQNFLSIIYFCVIFTFGLYGLSISFLSFIYFGILSFCGIAPPKFQTKHDKQSSIHYVE